MNTPMAVFGGLALIAVAVYAVGTHNGSAVAQTADGEWALLGHNEPLVIWKLNRKTGELFACTYKSKECAPVPQSK